MSNQIDKPREACGIAAVVNVPEAANLVYLMLYGLQHRGQEGAGIIARDENGFTAVKGSGLVADVFNEEKLGTLPGKTSIGHVRYSTTGGSVEQNAQPILVEYSRGNLALAHNGNLVNADAIRHELVSSGSIFQTTADSEVLIHLLSRNQEKDFIKALSTSLEQLKGAYSFLLLNDEALYAIRDPYGFRPLAIGKLGGNYVVASETCSFDLIGADYIRDVEPGEIVKMSKYGLESYRFADKRQQALCIFEYIYFSRPDSIIFGNSCWEARRRLGQMLAKENQHPADLVIPVPDSGVCTAIGFSQEAGIPFEMALIRNHYIGRTFIEPSQSIRDFGVKLKFNVVKEAVRGKRVVVIDDSLVRGTTARKIVKMIRQAGAKEIHMKLSSPAVKYPCFYGMDFPTRKELIAATHSVDEITRHLRVDSVAYLSQEGMLAAMTEGKDCFCQACFDGNYPVDFGNRDELSGRDISEKQLSETRSNRVG
ncbi:amidophosphoribosyltransferase [bacterium]|nr:amidophosphoribosyltransferase [bacterium]